MAAQSKNNESTDAPRFSGLQALGLCVWLIAVGLAAYFSPNLALFALVGTVLLLYMVLETGHRKAGDAHFENTLESLRQDHAVLVQDVARTRADIDHLKDAVPMAVKTTPPRPEKSKEPLEKPRVLQLKPAVSMPTPAPVAAKAEESIPDFSGLSDVVVRELVQHAVGSERIDLFLQPIMRLPQRKMRFFEMYSRVRARAGEYIPANRYMPLSDRDTISQIDTLSMLRCLRILKNTEHLKRAAPFFINIGANTLKNARFMENLLGFVAKDRALAPRIIFEMKQEDFEALPMQVLQILTGLSKLGCSFSLDHVMRADMDVALLMRYRVRFIKLDAGWLVHEARKGEARIAEINRIKRKLEANGIGVIVEKIESEEMMKQLLDFDVHYGQGFLFGKPELEGAYRQGKVA